MLFKTPLHFKNVGLNNGMRWEVSDPEMGAVGEWNMSNWRFEGHGKGMLCSIDMQKEGNGAVWSSGDELVGSAAPSKDLKSWVVLINAEKQEYLLPLGGDWRTEINVLRFSGETVTTVKGTVGGEVICGPGLFVASQVLFITLTMTLWRRAEIKDAVVKGTLKLAGAVAKGIAGGELGMTF
jgi:hypothetical protein